MKQQSNLFMTEAQALAEANRCLCCHDAPCRNACPANVDVPRFVQRIATGDYAGAAQCIAQHNPLGLVCAQVCPSDTLCRGSCNCSKLGAAIQISALQGFAMRRAVLEHRGRRPEAFAIRSQRVAVIGGGPSGIAAAALMSKDGYPVTLFERSGRLGGVPMDEIPNARLDKTLFEAEIERLLTGNVEIRLNTEVDERKAGEIGRSYDVIYVACGLGEPKPGVAVEADGVYSAETFLRLANSNMLENGGVKGIVYVQGGGNTAMDAAVCAKALGADRVLVSYRRNKAEMPAWDEAYLAAVKAGVEFLFQTQVVDVKATDGRIAGIILAPVFMGAPDEKGRRSPIIQAGKGAFAPAQLLITATGKAWNSAMMEGFAYAQAQGSLFVGGDAENGGLTVVQSIADAKQAVGRMQDYLQKRAGQGGVRIGN